LIYNHRKYPIPVDELYLEADPYEIGIYNVPLMPLEWICLIAIATSDELLLAALKSGRIDSGKVLKIAEMMGLSYYLKSRIMEF
jgi:hypothetical protein